MPKPSDASSSTRGLFQALTDLTAFITSHVYELSGPRGMYGQVTMHPEAEEVRKEIRVLKGMVLNRSVDFTSGLRCGRR
jgi:hypothetical protein